MKESETTRVPPGLDPDDSPFETPAIEGMPFKHRSAEDLAIRRIIEREAAAEKHSN